MTRTPCWPRIKSWISARARASTAASSSRRARRRKSWPARNRITGAVSLRPRAASPCPLHAQDPRGLADGAAARAANNLKNIDVNIPLGVIGGRHRRIRQRQILARQRNHLQDPPARPEPRARRAPAQCDGIDGLEQLDKVIAIDQSPIGRTPRSNPATYTGLFDMIREVFAATPEAKARGYKEDRFSFNVRGGRCEACSGDGILQHRDALSAGYLRALRGLQGQAL